MKFNVSAAASVALCGATVTAQSYPVESKPFHLSGTFLGDTGSQPIGVCAVGAGIEILCLGQGEQPFHLNTTANGEPEPTGSGPGLLTWVLKGVRVSNVTSDVSEPLGLGFKNESSNVELATFTPGNANSVELAFDDTLLHVVDAETKKLKMNWYACEIEFDNVAKIQAITYPLGGDDTKPKDKTCKAIDIAKEV